MNGDISNSTKQSVNIIITYYDLDLDSDTDHFSDFSHVCSQSISFAAYGYPQPPPSATNLTVAGPCHSALELSCVTESQFAILIHLACKGVPKTLFNLH